MTRSTGTLLAHFAHFQRLTHADLVAAQLDKPRSERSARLSRSARRGDDRRVPHVLDSGPDNGRERRGVERLGLHRVTFPAQG